MGGGDSLWLLQAEPKNEKMSSQMLCGVLLWKPQVSADANAWAYICFSSHNDKEELVPFLCDWL